MSYQPGEELSEALEVTGDLVKAIAAAQRNLDEMFDGGRSSLGSGVEAIAPVVDLVDRLSSLTDQARSRLLDWAARAW